MKITKQPKATTTSDMLNAFEDKLAELEVTSSTKVQCSDEACDVCVEIFPEDYEEEYTDVGGGFGEVGEIITLGEAKEYWNNNHDGDPCLEYYSSFEDWWNDTVTNYLDARMM